MKILIFGPIGDYGGRELEVSFVTNALSQNFEISLLSTSNFTKNSQLFNFGAFTSATSIDKELYKKSFVLKGLAYLSRLKSKNTNDIYSFVNNTIAKEYFGYESHAKDVILEHVKMFDAVVVFANLSSKYIRFVINGCKENDIPIIFRTTAAIDKKKDITSVLSKVDLFIHHSYRNANQLNILSTHNHTVIDQCNFIEAALLELEVPIQIKRLLYIGRLSEEKGIRELLIFAANSGFQSELWVVGDGPLEEELRRNYEHIPHIVFKGFVKQKDLPYIYKQVDALIIPSFEESGPIVGLEAMAAGRIIISTKVGAMEERLKGTPNQFWFDINDSESFDKALNKLLQLKSKQIETISNSLRERYIKSYTFKHISDQYNTSVVALLKTKD